MEIRKHRHVKIQRVKKYSSKNKKALSSIVMMVILVALVVSLMAIVFNLTKKTVNSKIKKTNSCGLNIMDKLSISDEYVCYNSTNKSLVLSIGRKDIDMDKLLIAIETNSNISKYYLTENSSYNLNILNSNRTTGASLPSKGSGKTYIILNVEEKPINVQIAPIINGEQCDFVDSINNIINCSLTSID